MNFVALIAITAWLAFEKWMAILSHVKKHLGVLWNRVLELLHLDGLHDDSPYVVLRLSRIGYALARLLRSSQEDEVTAVRPPKAADEAGPASALAAFLSRMAPSAEDHDQQVQAFRRVEMLKGQLDSLAITKTIDAEERCEIVAFSADGRFLACR